MPEPSLETSLSLVERVRRREPEAWRQLVTLYGPIVYYWCRQRCGLNDHDSEDLGQEVFASVFRSMASFEYAANKGSFRGWLWTITINRVRDLARRRQGQTRAVGGGFPFELIECFADSEPPPPSDEQERSAIYRSGLELIKSEFTDRSWLAFWRTAVDGQSSADVAEELNMTAMAVRKAKSRVLSRLRRELEGLIEGVAEPD